MSGTGSKSSPGKYGCVHGVFGKPAGGFGSSSPGVLILFNALFIISSAFEITLSSFFASSLYFSVPFTE